MSFVHECNKNNRDDNRRDEFAWHNKILSNLLRFITLFVQINKMTISVGECLELKQLGESVNLCSMERVAGLQQGPTGHSFKKTFFFALFRNDNYYKNVHTLFFTWLTVTRSDFQDILVIAKVLSTSFTPPSWRGNSFYSEYFLHTSLLKR